MKNKKTNNNKKKHWIFIVTSSTIILAVMFSMISEAIIRNLNIYFAFLTLIVIVCVGVIFDIIGVASAVVNEKDFHAMASKKIEIAFYCLFITKHAAKFSSFCSDVVGDISGIVSGAAGSIIIIGLINTYGLKNGTILSILMSALIAGITVGGKALGKDLAIDNSKKIILTVAELLRKAHKFVKFDYR